jgi:hypothetical protein
MALEHAQTLEVRVSGREGHLRRCYASAKRALDSTTTRTYHRLVANLEVELARDVHKAPAILRQRVVREVLVGPHEPGEHLVARIGHDLKKLLQAAAASEIFMVAGAVFPLA